MPHATAPLWSCDPLTAALANELAAEWDALASAAAEPNLFQLRWFILPSLPLLAPYAPRLVTIRDDGQLIGLIIVRGDRGFAKMPLHFLRTARHYEQYLGTPLVRTGYERRFAAGLLAWLDAAPRRYCLLHLGLLAADGPIAAALAAQCEAEGRSTMRLNRFVRAAIAVPPEPSADPDAHLSANRRKSLRRYRAGLAHLGNVTREQLTKAADIGAWRDDFLAMEHAGWKGTNGSSILSCPHETALYQALVAEAFERGVLNFWRLCCDDRPVAYTLDIAVPPAVFCLKTAFDPDFRKYAPGVIAEHELMHHYLEQPGPLLIDSCTSPGNSLLNELWPDQRPIMALSIARKGVGYTALFALARFAKRLKYGRDAL